MLLTKCKDRPSDKQYYQPKGWTKWKWLFQIIWLNIIWHWKNPYGYCEGHNWNTCVDINKNNNKVDCPFIKHGVHCYHIIGLYHPKFDSKEAWEKW